MVNQIPLKKSDVRVHQLEQGVVLYNPRTDEVHLLNPAALLVWECSTGDYTLTGIARLLGSVYGLDTDLSVEVQKIVEQFAEKALLEIMYQQ